MCQFGIPRNPMYTDILICKTFSASMSEMWVYSKSVSWVTELLEFYLHQLLTHGYEDLLSLPLPATIIDMGRSHFSPSIASATWLNPRDTANPSHSYSDRAGDQLRLPLTYHGDVSRSWAIIAAKLIPSYLIFFIQHLIFWSTYVTFARTYLLCS